MEKLKMSSPDMLSENVEKIAALFPNCVTETAEGKAIDFDLLKQELNNEVIEGNKERYRLEWPGKREAIVTANLPTTKTLRPVREDSVDFDNTENLYIEGDNLEVLKLLQESYLNKVKMIYIDPPYNTGKDLIYKNDFSESEKDYQVSSGVIDNQGLIAINNSENNGRYHSNWLTMMYPLIKNSRNLLTSDGMIAITIDHFELANLTCICDEIFGYRNRVGIIAVRNNPAGRSTVNGVSITHEYLLIYSKSENSQLGRLPRNKKQIARYNEKDSIGLFEWVNFRKPGSKRAESPKMFYPIFGSKNGLRIPSMEWDNLNKEWILNENPKNGETIVFPVDDNGKDRRWRWAIDRAKEEITELDVKIKNNDEVHIYLKGRMPNEGIMPNTWWDKKEYSSTAYGTNLLKDIFGELQVFSYPKSIYAVKDALRICSTGDNDIILDFFSGSSTTAHAVFELNAENNSNKKFIMVQLPVETKYEGDPNVSKFKTICDVAKERIRLSGERVKKDNNADIDYGFRVYRLDESNMQDVYYKPQEYEQGHLDLVADNVKSDRTADDLLAQVMLDWGLPLSLKIEQLDVLGKKLFKVAENSLFACFDTGIDEEFVKEIAKESPLRIVFKDSAFKDDTAKVNVKQLLKQLSPETEMKVI
jgi:adenine-specific DNA-methyltransferase